MSPLTATRLHAAPRAGHTCPSAAPLELSSVLLCAWLQGGEVPKAAVRLSPIHSRVRAGAGTGTGTPSVSTPASVTVALVPGPHSAHLASTALRSCSTCVSPGARPCARVIL